MTREEFEAYLESKKIPEVFEVRDIFDVESNFSVPDDPNPDYYSLDLTTR